jgi:hypothetical protein
VSSGILLSLRVSVSPERAFEVFTGEIGRWWRPNGFFRFTKRASLNTAAAAISRSFFGRLWDCPWNSFSPERVPGPASIVSCCQSIWLPDRARVYRNVAVATEFAAAVSGWPRPESVNPYCQ